MPKVIKKKVVKQEAGAEESVKTFFTGAAEKLDSNLRSIAISAAVALAIAAAVAGFFIYKGGVGKKAEADLYEGYKLYHGLSDAQALTPAERLDRALASFKKSYEGRPSPQALLYIANVQYAMGRLDEALSSLAELERDFPADDVYVPLAIYKSAMAQLRAGKPDEALKTFDRLYAHRSGSYRDLALVESARTLEALGKKEDAARKYEAILKDHPGSAFADEARVKTGKKEEAHAGGS